jgi:hypothetical protein
VSTHKIYEFDVEFTQVVDHRDQCGDHTHNSEHPGTKATVRVVMDQYLNRVAEAWCDYQFRHSKGYKILARRSHDVALVLSI